MSTNQTEIRSTEDIAKTVRALRKRQGVSQTVVAQLSNVGGRFVFDLERGKSTVRLDKVLAVLRTMGIKMKLQLPQE